MTKPTSFRELIDSTFGGREPFAEATGISIGHVDVMKHRDSIAPDHWPSIVEAGRRLSREITLADLADLRRQRKGLPSNAGSASGAAEARPKAASTYA